MNGDTDQCNVAWNLIGPLTLVGNYDHWEDGKAEMSSIENQVDNCLVLCVRINWNSGGGHFVTVYGYEADILTQYLYIGDPWYGPSVVEYASYPDLYNGGGTWTDTYYTKR